MNDRLDKTEKWFSIAGNATVIIGFLAVVIATIVSYIIPLATSVAVVASLIGLLSLLILFSLNFAKPGFLYRKRIMRYLLALVLASYIAGFVHYWSETFDTDTRSTIRLRK